MSKLLQITPVLLWVYPFVTAGWGKASALARKSLLLGALSVQHCVRVQAEALVLSWCLLIHKTRTVLLQKDRRITPQSVIGKSEDSKTKNHTFGGALTPPLTGEHSLGLPCTLAKAREEQQLRAAWVCCVHWHAVPLAQPAQRPPVRQLHRNTESLRLEKPPRII